MRVFLSLGILILSITAKAVCPQKSRENFFPSFADQSTEVLWLFDDSQYPGVTLTDASENEYDLRLMAGGSLEPGVFGQGLRTKPGKDYKVSFAGFQGSISNQAMREKDGVQSGLWDPTADPRNLLDGLTCGNFTIEMRVNLKSAGRGNITLMDLGDARLPGVELSIENQTLILTHAYLGVQAAFKMPRWDQRSWHHLAVVKKGSQWDFYWDGKRQSLVDVSKISKQDLPPSSQPKDLQHENRGFTKDSPLEWRRDHRFNISLGEDRRKENEVDVVFDEVRISSVARYTGEFADPGSFSRKKSRAKISPRFPILFTKNRGPIDLGGRKHLFIDMAFIEQSQGVGIKLNDLKNPEPLQVVTDNGVVPFTSDQGSWRESIFDNEGKVNLFIADGYSSSAGISRLFQSQDGIRFESPKTVMKAKPQGAVVFRDTHPDLPPEETFKMTSWSSNRGIYLFMSPDGIHWRRNEVSMLPMAIGSDPETFWDDQRSVYFTHMKRDSSVPSSQTTVSGRSDVFFKSPSILKPWPFKKLSKPYFESWSVPTVSDEGVTALQARLANLAPHEEVYRSRAMKYPWAPDTYIALPWRSVRYGLTSQVLATELAVSRDGENWTDYPHTDYGFMIPPIGQIDGVAVTSSLSFYGMIRRDDEIWLYVEYNTDQAVNGKDGKKFYARVRLDLDRFADLNAGRSKGWATTKPFKFSGSKLELNLMTTEGDLKVALLDEKGVEIPGFSSKDCDSLTNLDTIRKTVSWKGNTNVKALQGKVVRLRFEMDNAKIFALRFF